ncbi:MAG TPA: hypothetical protein PK988_07195, partial [Candidatus Sumerlaeota bacterium]|nr:hypothetical protein [Candidatus Sumerlaeota bacterium]
MFHTNTHGLIHPVLNPPVQTFPDKHCSKPANDPVSKEKHSRSRLSSAQPQLSEKVTRPRSLW